MAQGDNPTESHDLEKANVVDGTIASQQPSSDQAPSSSASASASVDGDGEKQAQSSAESLHTSEAGQRYLVSS